MMDLLDGAERLLPRLLGDLERLVRQESPTGDPAVSAASAAVVSDLGTRLLAQAPEVIVVDGCTHLSWRLGQGRRRLLLLAHHDTVWPQGTLERLPWSIDGGLVRGPGSFDMKAGLVQALHALAMLVDLRGAEAVNGVTLLVSGDEEIGSPSSRALIEEAAAACEAVLVLEAAGPGGALKTARKGVSLYTVRILGRAAHAGLEPEAGANAAVELAHQTLAIAALGDPAAGTSVTPTVSSAGTTTNTVPAQATLSVDVRAFSSEEQDRVHLAMLGLEPLVAGCRIEVAGGPNRPPMAPDSSARLFELADAAAGRLGLGPLAGIAVGGGSDGNFTAGIGVPTLDGLGAVGGGAHADDEHVAVSDIPARTALLAALIESILGVARA